MCPIFRTVSTARRRWEQEGDRVNNRNLYVPEEPGIRLALETGYPRRMRKTPRCDRCGEDIQTDTYLRLFGRKLCQSCIEHCTMWNEQEEE